MICVRLNGGLGNQLFQYAAGRALALRHNTDLLLDISFLQLNKPGVTKRIFELNHFNHIGQIATKSESRTLPYLHHIASLSHLFTPWYTYIENNTFNTAFMDLPDQTYLVGYWQSYRYFSNIVNQLIADFIPRKIMSSANLLLKDKIITTKSVAFHVRRGDYVSLHSAAKYHGALPLSYYTNAIMRVSAQINYPQYFVFSDDPVWCRANLPLEESNTTYVTHNAGNDAWQDLLLMGYCRHHVIANSSFSWWGAWLADQCYGILQRLVVAPEHWFIGKNEKDLSDRFPHHWVTQI